jgi:3-oxoacyl-[acyl-carrier protein] reductase
MVTTKDESNTALVWHLNSQQKANLKKRHRGASRICELLTLAFDPRNNFDMKNIQFKFDNYRVVVTGGAQGIGLRISELFLMSGAHVDIWDFSETSLRAAEAKLKPFSSLLQLNQVDVRSTESCNNAVARLNGLINVLVNNAGITRDKSLTKMTDEDFDAVIQTNLSGLFHVTKALLEKFGDPKRIINMSSIVALYGNFGQTNYVAAKAGVIGMTKTWARELGRKGFTVNAIAPGFTKTSMTEAVPPAVLKSIEEKVPVQRLGEVDDIANACLFLASAEAAYINGITLSVDGGLVL